MPFASNMNTLIYLGLALCMAFLSYALFTAAIAVHRENTTRPHRLYPVAVTLIVLGFAGTITTTAVTVLLSMGVL